MLASYDNQSYQGVFNNMGEFIALNKEKKKQMVMYLLYPKSYGRLEYERNKEESIVKFCDVCDKEFIGFCVYCAAKEELAQLGDVQNLVFTLNDDGENKGLYGYLFYQSFLFN